MRASAVEAKGDSRLKTENGPLGRRDRAKWNRSKVTPLNKWPYGEVFLGLRQDTLGSLDLCR